jgi:hypothetical protein
MGDDAERALTPPRGRLLAARIGIATGFVVVGDLIGEAEPLPNNLAIYKERRCCLDAEFISGRFRRIDNSLSPVSPIQALVKFGLVHANQLHDAEQLFPRRRANPRDLGI